jgi:KUP system potassium uptake protein
MSVVTEEIPQVPTDERVEFVELGHRFYSLVAHYGFMESPDIPTVLRQIQSRGVTVRPLETTFYLGRESLIPMRDRKPEPDAPVPERRMSMWRKHLFVLMSRNAQPATQFFGLPPNRVVEMGAQIQF